MYGMRPRIKEFVFGSMIILLVACSAPAATPISSPTILPTATLIPKATAIPSTPTPTPTDVSGAMVSPTILPTAAPPTLIPEATAIPPTPIPTLIDVSAATLPTKTPLTAQAPFGIEMLPGYEIEHILRPALVMPSDVRVGPDGRIFFVEWEGHRILELGYDGTTSVVLELEKPFNSILIDSVGAFFVMQGDELIKISPTGERDVFARTNAPGGWAFDSQDNLFMVVGGDLLRFSPAGEKSLVATGVENGGMGIGPSGDVFIGGSTGGLLRVTRDGEVETLVGGFAYESFNIGFDHQGNLYQNSTYFTQVSLEDGSLSPPLLREYNVLLVSRPFAFTPSGDAIFIGPTSNNAFKASMQDETVSVLLEGTGNSRALAVGPAGDLFMGASNEFPLAPGRVLKVLPDGSANGYATGFFTVRDLVFDDEGNVFVSDFDHGGEGGGRVIKITPIGLSSIILSGFYDLTSMVYDPIAGDILAFEQNRHQLIRITQEGTVTSIPIDFGGEAIAVDLAFDDDGGDFIALVVFLDGFNTGPVHRGLYRISSEYEATLIADIDTPLASSEDDVAVGPSGDIFVVGPEEHPDFRMLRISPEGEVSVVARNLPYDTLGEH